MQLCLKENIKNNKTSYKTRQHINLFEKYYKIPAVGCFPTCLRKMDPLER
jgi:hypothetical protein